MVPVSASNLPEPEPEQARAPEPASDDVPQRREDAIRVSDADRDAVINLLGEHATSGRLTLAEHTERIEQAMEAKTRGELERLLTDLPGTENGIPQKRRRKLTRWVLSLMGGTDRTGRWRVDERVHTITIMGGCDLDLRNAELDSDDTVITAWTWMGGTNIYVPDSVDLEVTGFSLMGGRSERGTTRSPRPGAPRVTIRSFNLMGDCQIYKLPDETRGLSPTRAARELRREQRRGGGFLGM